MDRLLDLLEAPKFDQAWESFIEDREKTLHLRCMEITRQSLNKATTKWKDLIKAAAAGGTNRMPAIRSVAIKNCTLDAAASKSLGRFIAVIDPANLSLVGCTIHWESFIESIKTRSPRLKGLRIASSGLSQSAGEVLFKAMALESFLRPTLNTLDLSGNRHDVSNLTSSLLNFVVLIKLKMIDSKVLSSCSTKDFAAFRHALEMNRCLEVLDLRKSLLPPSRVKPFLEAIARNEKLRSVAVRFVVSGDSMREECCQILRQSDTLERLVGLRYHYPSSARGTNGGGTVGKLERGEDGFIPRPVYME